MGPFRLSPKGAISKDFLCIRSLMKTIKPSSGQEGTVLQDATDECVLPAGGLPACPDLELWISECKDEWLKADVLEVLDGPLDVAWARIKAAARLERFGFDEVDDVTAPSRVRTWARTWSLEGVGEVEYELSVRAGLFLDDLLEAQEAALTSESASIWTRQMASVLRRRDDLDAVCVLLRAQWPVGCGVTLQALDDHGVATMAALPAWELDKEWICRVSIGLPDAWWVQPRPGLDEAPPPPPQRHIPVSACHAPDFRQPWYDGNSLPFED